MNARDEYVAGLKSQLDDWNADLARWEAKARTAKEEAKERYERELDVLRAQRELARYNLTLLESASASAWSDLRQGVDEAWERMRAAIGSASGHFEKR